MYPDNPLAGCGERGSPLVALFAVAFFPLCLCSSLEAANNPLADKLLDGDNKAFISPRGDAVTLKDLRLDTIPLGNHAAVRLVPWAKIPGEVSQMTYAGERLFFATVPGKIWEYTPQGKRIKPELLNIAEYRPAFSLDGSYSGKGLRGFAFHPDFASNGLLYTLHEEIDAPEKASHGERDTNLHYVLGEWQLDPARKKPPVFRSVLRVGYRATDHVGGQIGFNPSAKTGDSDYGMLYAGFGDGGDVCSWQDTCLDQFHYGQDFSTIQSSIIRINPLRQGQQPYSIPADNPFVGHQDAKPPRAAEIFAKGFRNPATLMFDQQNGRIFSGDISQNSIEEINLVEKGHNYGWGLYEGTWLYTDLTDTDNKLRYVPLGDGSDVSLHSTTYYGKNAAGKPVTFANINRRNDGFTSPVLQFSHRQNGGVAAAITGTVYRGTRVPELQGLFLFGNLSQDKLYYAQQADLENNELPAQGFELKILDEKNQPSSLGAIIIGSNSHTKDVDATLGKNRTNIRFGQDQAGNIYIISKQNNMIYQLESPL